MILVGFNNQSLVKFYLFRHLQAFQKVRDCSHIHDHSGTSARIQVFYASIWFTLYFLVLLILVDRRTTHEETPT